ncbi:integrase core domain-containing protein [Methylovorus sp. MP688]|uniref:integrase core domain-containing protein n=1 Tax=Methylovorus sp. (strain MP688) TaxID=887061 RepID=UPI00350F09B1
MRNRLLVDLNDRWFEILLEGIVPITDWQKYYNEVRPHSSRKLMPPTKFAALHHQQKNVATQ